MAQESLEGRQRVPFCIAVTEKVWRRTCGVISREMRAVEDVVGITGRAPYTTYGLVNTLRASSSRRRLVSCA